MPQRRAKKTTVSAADETPNRHADSTPQQVGSIPQQEGVISPQTGQEPGLSQVMQTMVGLMQMQQQVQ